ncbi:MinD/ParA family protein [Ferviditalea candida]|uniref:MinD/ParA family protein n=1 Tax=Ferviditalea candida TaxID=3108399 RepID=A0ABU5ZJ77_9BACL|nr:MinD/ParA family protein [Paenibacillaceae bacterium T2]
MNDQAQGLRNLVNNHHEENTRSTRIITITSGKGGVGKSNFTLNFALSLKSLGYKVLVFDADIGFANIDVLMGTPPKYTLYHLLNRQKTIWEVISSGMNDLKFISGGSGFNDLFKLSEDELEYFFQQVDELEGYVDYILFDTGAGLSKETLKFIVAANDTIVVTTPEPTSITDAYAIIKMVSGMNVSVPFHLVVNRAADLKEGKRTAEKITMVAKQFLDLNLTTLGYILDDHHVMKAVKQQVPFSIAYPNSSAAKCVKDLAGNFVSGSRLREQSSGGFKAFINKFVQLMK